MSKFSERLKAFLHDPINKCFDIPTHVKRAKNYAEKLGVVFDEGEIKGVDQIASCMERSFLPPKIIQDFTEIRHPLSSGKIRIKETINKKEVFLKVEKIYKTIGEEISFIADEKKKFFWLWRNLQERLFEGLKEEDWAKFLSVLPADTRIPDHSIWEHLKIASALNVDKYLGLFLQNNFLFLFTIGPVQSFITQARKTQDFYMGSFLLSYLTFVAIRELIGECGPTSIIYPDLYKQPLADWFLEEELKLEIPDFEAKDLLLPTIPNRFVAIVPESKEDKIKELAGKLEKAVKGEVIRIKDSLLKTLSIPLNEDQKRALDAQLEEFPQIYWVAIPWKIDERDVKIEDFEDILPSEFIKHFKKLYTYVKENGEFLPNMGFLYGLMYSALEKALGMRKNLRSFKQNSETGRKCSLCGERNVLFFKDNKNPKKFTFYNEPKPVDLTSKKEVSLKFVQDGEGLCGVCFIKRCLEKYLEKKVDEVFQDTSFPSTAEIACANFKEKALKIAGKELKEYQEQFKKVLKNKFQWTSPVPKLEKYIKNIMDNLEGHWFYEENLREKELKRSLEVSVSENNIKELKKCLKNLTEKTGIPSPYYAVIKLDGDNMGKWLSGELLPEIEHAYNSEVWAEKLPGEFKEKIIGLLKNLDISEEKKKGRKMLTPAIHASISTALRNYTLEFVRKVVEEEHLGKLVYAGGDDILAFVNLRDLWDVMHKLRACFSGQIRINEKNEIEIDWDNTSGFVEKDGKFILTMGPEATASMGVVIAHYKMPLQIVLNRVSSALDKAKSCKHGDKEKMPFV